MSSYPDGMDWRAFDRRYGEDLRYESELQTSHRAAASIYAKLQKLKAEAEEVESLLSGCEDPSDEVDDMAGGWRCLLEELNHALIEAKSIVHGEDPQAISERLKNLLEMAR